MTSRIVTPYMVLEAHIRELQSSISGLGTGTGSGVTYTGGVTAVTNMIPTYATGNSLQDSGMSLLSGGGATNMVSPGVNSLNLWTASVNKLKIDGTVAGDVSILGGSYVAGNAGVLSTDTSGKVVTSPNVQLVRDKNLSGVGGGSCLIAGAGSGQALTSGTIASTVYGSGTGNLMTGFSNSLFGATCAVALTSGAGNTCIGLNSGNGLTTGSGSVCVGFNSGGSSLQTGSNGVFVGIMAASSGNFSNQIALGAVTVSNASNECVIGNGITVMKTTTDNTCDIGSNSVKYKDLYMAGTLNGISRIIPTGVTDSVKIGNNAGGNDGNTAMSNVSIGNGAGHIITTAANNIIIGDVCAQELTQGNNNILLGQYAGRYIATGDENVFIGDNTWTQNGAGGGVADMNKSVVLGAGSRVSGDSAIALGYGVEVSSGVATNECCIGNTSATVIYNQGNGTCDLGKSSKKFKDVYALTVKATNYNSPNGAVGISIADTTGQLNMSGTDYNSASLNGSFLALNGSGTVIASSKYTQYSYTVTLKETTAATTTINLTASKWGDVVTISLDTDKILPSVNGSLVAFSSHTITNSPLLPKGPYVASAYINDNTNTLHCLVKLSSSVLSFSRLDGNPFATSQHTISAFTIVYRSLNSDPLTNTVWGTSF